MPDAPLGRNTQYWATEVRGVVTNIQGTAAFMYTNAITAEDATCKNPLYSKPENREATVRKGVKTVRKNLPFLKNQLAQLEKSLEKLAEEGY